MLRRGPLVLEKKPDSHGAGGARLSRLPFALLLALGCGGGQAAAPEDPPAPLADVVAAATSPTEVLISWAPAAPGGARRIEVERALGSTSFAPVASVAGDLTRYLDGGLEPATLYRYRVRACGPSGCSAFAEAAASTLSLLVVTTAALPDGVRGQPYDGALHAEGGAAGYSWSVQSGSLPAGLSLSEEGIISGIPETVQTAVFVARVRSEDGQNASRELELRVVEPGNGAGVAVLTPLLPPALQGGSYTVSLQADGGDGSVYVWSVAEGTLPPGLSLAPAGSFSGSPTAVGSFAFTLAVASGGRSARRTFTLRVVPNETTRFQITLFEVAVVPAEIRPHLEEAVARWERVITGDLGATQIPQRFFSSTFCGGFGQLVNGTTLDDVIVMADISPIDGPGRILGQAGPCGLRSANGLPFVGLLTLDAEDLAPLVGTATLSDVIFHEIAHVLGFGGLWAGRELLTGGGTANPRFVGAAGRQEYAALGGTGDVPVENTGGTGTADAHWRESIFRTEIMTGFSERVGTRMPLSRLTIAAMSDLGYVVDLGQADPYSLPGTAGAPPAAPLAPLGWDRVLQGPVRYLPEGEPER